MKQRITIGQLNKLTPVQKQCLREWYRDAAEPGDYYQGDKDDYSEFADIKMYYEADRPDEYSLPLLSIGQMIQFIQEKKPSLKGISKARFDKWFVNIDTAQLGYKDELCDALWEATTQILKNP